MCTAVSISFSVGSLVSVSASTIATCNGSGEVLTVVPGEAGILARAVGRIALKGCGEEVIRAVAEWEEGEGFCRVLPLLGL